MLMKPLEELSQNMQEYWDGQTPLFEEIKRAGGISSYFKSFKEKGDLFRLENRSICCVDERTTEGKIHYAGSGILDQANALENTRKANADGIYSHEGCGAAAVAFENLSQAEKGTFPSAEAYAAWWAKHVSEELHIPYKGHLAVHPKFHIARVTYYDGTGQFDPTKSEKLPRGFMISRAYLDPQYAAKELELSIKIAFGEHGFGKKEFRHSPFMIIPVADSKNSGITLQMLKQEAREIAYDYGETVTIDELIADLGAVAQKS
jgi:hypothetical protein